VLHPRPAAVRIVASFVVPCPQKLQRRADARPTTKKDDLDKLTRTLFDALTGIAYDDDSQVVECHVSKRYPRGGDVVGVSVWIIGDEDGKTWDPTTAADIL
jgi:Holliday junction resolvase RusA-like endonuclease